jgi:hypothetical protein
MKHYLFISLFFIFQSIEVGTTSSIIVASQIPGVVLDENVHLGTGACTDNTTALNAAIAGASEANPVKLIIDGGSCTTGIVGPAGGHWWIEGIGPGSGLFVIAGSNAAPIANTANYGFTGTAPGTKGHDITISNIELNGNVAGFPNGNSTRTDSRGDPWIPCIAIGSVIGVRLDHIYSHDCPTYAVVMSDVSLVTADFNRFESPLGVINRDGIHIDGPASYIAIDHTYCSLGDDCVALNAPEGYGGDIHDVTVKNTQLNGPYGLRVYQSYVAHGPYKTNHVIIDGVTGHVTGVGFSLTGGNDIESPRDYGDVTISNVYLQADTNFVNMAGSWSRFTCVNCTWVSPTAAVPMFATNGYTYVSSMTLSHTGIHRDTVGHAAAYGVQLVSSTGIARLRLEDFFCEDEQGQSYPACPQILDSTSNYGVVGTLEIGSLIDSSKITSLMSAQTTPRVSTLLGAANFGPPATSTTVDTGSLAPGYTSVSVSLNPPASFANNAILRYGYAEDGAPTNFYCTTSPVVCSVMAPCANGCTLSVPAIIGRVLYYQWQYRDGANNVLGTSATETLVVP